MSRSKIHESLSVFHPLVREWFQESFPEPTDAQKRAWREIERGEHTLLLAPTGSGKTLAAFLVAINRIMLGGADEKAANGVKVLYISPLKALGADVERNLRAPMRADGEEPDGPPAHDAFRARWRAVLCLRAQRQALLHLRHSVRAHSPRGRRSHDVFLSALPNDRRRS